MVVNGWIWNRNLRPFVEELAVLAGYKLTYGEFEAIDLAVEQTNSDIIPPVWYEDEIRGKQLIRYRIGWEQGTDVLLVSVEVADHLAEKAETMISLMSRYTLK